VQTALLARIIMLYKQQTSISRILLFLMVISLSVSCRKSASGSTGVQYQFSADVSASYTIEYSSDIGTIHTETLQGKSWSKAVTAKTNADLGNITTARLVVYPPAAWANTANSAHVNLKILVNGSEKANTDSVMTSSNIGIGILQLYTF
jgi:hypothetical protein